MFLANPAAIQHVPVNPYERAARLEKAFTLAGYLYQHGISAGSAFLQTPAEWVSTAACAGVLPPSAETVRETMQALEDLEALQGFNGAQKVRLS